MSEPSVDPLFGCWFLTGATAGGKTAVGIELAERLGAEILSLDSMAIYRGMDIGTAKPSTEQRSRVTHHLLDLIDPTDAFSVSQYRDRAFETIAEVRSRGNRVLFVGGTPLYLKALLRGIFEGPAADWDFRREIEAEIERHGVEALHERLKLVDPLAAHKLHPHDRRRLIRALEVHHVTGQPISHLQLEFDEPVSDRPVPVFVLHHERERLHRRIEERVEGMFAAGLVDEVRALLARHGELGRTAGQAVGYRETIEHLSAQFDLPTCIERVKARTRQFARRQETWFRSFDEARFIELGEPVDRTSLVERLVRDGHEIESRAAGAGRR
ncbi:MAG TPA: tRNA (adenosine(37)-N6)-dimethylallyltransferase MiaA [Planctomycetaceae bacterium]|nr:tRNA (adenosine(37)-N6)-dimethylallyltransferase MiaA [Planctomycetaceae bacterium]HRE99458.1 tRNA (adenosine(37)-N6)-dimethylallyltransferase MiaA [Pirellulaceae bacterium]